MNLEKMNLEKMIQDNRNGSIDRDLELMYHKLKIEECTIDGLVDALNKIADLKLASTDGQTDFSISQDRWFKFCEAKAIAESAIEQYRKEPTVEDKPLTAEELDVSDAILSDWAEWAVTRR